MRSIPTLSVRQPWALALVTPAPGARLASIKPIENRTWKPPSKLIGQRIAIHASAGLPYREDVDEIRELWSGFPDVFFVGAIVGSVRLCGWATGDDGAHVADGPWSLRARDLPLGRWHRAGDHARWGQDGFVHWLVDHPILLSEPIAAKGRLGIWQYSTPSVDVAATLGYTQGGRS